MKSLSFNSFTNPFLLFAIILLSVSFEIHAQWNKRVVAYSGQEAPGTEGAEFNWPIGQFITNSGQIYFSSSLESGVGDGGGSYDVGIWFEKNDSLDLFIRSGKKIPHSDNIFINDFPDLHKYFIVDQKHDKIFLNGSFSADGVEFNEGFITAGENGFVALHSIKGLIPYPDARQQEIIGYYILGFKNGIVLIDAVLEDDDNIGWNNCFNQFLAKYKTDSNGNYELIPIVRGGDPMVGAEGQVYLNWRKHVLTYSSGPDQNGQAAIYGIGNDADWRNDQVRDDDVYTLYKLDSTGNLSLIRTMNQGEKKNVRASVKFNSAGEMAFNGGLNGELYGKYGIWVGKNQERVVALLGDKLPGITTGDSLINILEWTFLDDNRIVFYGALSGNKKGIWMEDKNKQLKNITITGQPLPNSKIKNGYDVFHYVCNSNGTIAFRVWGDDIENNIYNIQEVWAGGTDNLDLVIRTGDRIELGSGEVKTVESLLLPEHYNFHPFSSVSEIISTGGVNDHDEILINVEFKDRSDAVVVAYSGLAPKIIYEPSPSYTGPLYEGNPLTLIANPPDEGPYEFYWTGPNGFISSEENPLIGTATQNDAGIYTLNLIDEDDNETSVDINVDIVEDEIGMQYDEISLNYKNYDGMYPFNYLNCCICCEEENDEVNLESPPEMIEDLSKSEKQTQPNTKGPPSCETEVNTYSGNFFVQVPILSIPGLGPELSIEFAYNSCNTNLNYGYGNGWTFNYNLVWDKIGNDVHIFRGDGREDIFLYNSGDYLSPKGIYDTLISLGNEKYLLKTKHGTEFYFEDSTHKRLTKVKDRNNNELTLSYTDSLATAITAACGRSFHLEYNDGLLSKIMDDNMNPARSVQFEYDANKNLINITDPLNYSERFIYNIDRLIIQLIDKRSNVVEVDYNDDHAVKDIESSINHINFEYDLSNNQTLVTRMVGGSPQTTTYTYDIERRIIEISSNCCGSDVQFEYNSRNDVTRITDAMEQAYNYTYDLKGNVITETDPLNNIQEFQYDPKYSQLIHWKDKNGNIISYTVDNTGNVTALKFSSGITRDYSYYDNGLPETVTNGEGHTTKISYNNHGNCTSIEYPIGTEYFGYDDIGNLSQSVTPNGDTTSFNYDAKRQVLKTTDPLGNRLEKFYDPNGNEIWMKNKRGFVTKYNYDAHNRLVKIIQPQEIITTYEYDEKDNLIYLQNPNGNETRFTFNHRNQMTSKTNALGHTQYWEYDVNGNLIKETNFRGFCASYTYNELNLRTKIINAFGDTTKYQYDNNGNNTAVISPDGIVSAFQFNDMDQLINERHAYNHAAYKYDKNGNLNEVQDALGNSTKYEYDANDRLVKTIDALQQEMTFQYDDNGNRIATTDKMGNTDRVFYDVLNQSVLSINALGDSIKSSYDEAGNQISVANERGYSTEFFYDELERTISIQYQIGEQQFEYDNNGNTIKEKDALGRTTSFEYNAINQLTKTINADASSTFQSFDENGNRISLTNEENETEQYTYDELDRLSSSANGENETINYSYDELGNRTTSTLPSGNIISNVYDKESWFIATYDLLGKISFVVYDPLGNILSESDGNGNTTAHQYDKLRRKTNTTDPKGDVIQYGYDPNGNLVQTIDREDNITQQNYDALNRQIIQTDALSNTTSYFYEETGNLISITDANGNATAYEYDENDRLIKETFADGTTKEYTYDEVENIISRKDNAGNITQYEYNVRNRLTKRDYPGNNDDSFAFDLTGRMITASNSNANLVFNYDKAGRLLQEKLNGNTTAYSYDIPNQKRTINYSGGNIIIETMDKRSRLKQLERNGIVMANWYYDAVNQPKSRSYANDTYSHYVYNTSNWITSIQHSNANGNFINLKYTFDKEGNKLSEEKVHMPDHSEQYDYDDTYQFTDFKKGNISTGAFPNQSTFNYDPLGNRQQVISDSILTTYSSNEMNEYTAISGKSAPVYDANGNLIEDGNFTYQYDFENRLVSVNDGNIANYQYDPLGRRISKITATGTTKYFYDGARVIEEKDGLGNLTASHLYGTWIDDILVMRREANDYYYHKNSLGSVAALSDVYGDPVEYYDYDVYGEVIFYDNAFNKLNTSAVVNPYLFTGRRLDEEIGLLYFRARHIKSNLGRFIQRDPSGYKSRYNLYLFARNNPLMYVDPFGLKEEKKILSKKVYNPKGDANDYADFKLTIYSGCEGSSPYYKPPVIEDFDANWTIDDKRLNTGGSVASVGASIHWGIVDFAKHVRTTILKMEKCDAPKWGNKVKIRIRVDWVRVDVVGVSISLPLIGNIFSAEARGEKTIGISYQNVLIKCCCDDLSVTYGLE